MQESPYAPPQAEPGGVSSRRAWSPAWCFVAAAIQLFYLGSLVVALFGAVDLVGMLAEVRSSGEGDPRLLSGRIAETIVGFVMFAFPAWVGLVLGYLFLNRSSEIPGWFRAFSRGSAWLFLLFFPFGTVVGALTLRRLGRHQSLR